MGWIRCVCCEKLQRDFVVRTFVLITPVQYVLQQVSCSYETIPNAPKYNKTDRNICLGPTGWIGCVRCEKWRCDFVAWTFALIAPVQYVLQQVSRSYETIPNAPKYYKMHRNIGIGSNGVDWLRSLPKIPTWLRGTNFCINCTNSVTSFMRLRNDPKCTQIQRNAPKHWYRV